MLHEEKHSETVSHNYDLFKPHVRTRCIKKVFQPNEILSYRKVQQLVNSRVKSLCGTQPWCSLVPLAPRAIRIVLNRRHLFFRGFFFPPLEHSLVDFLDGFAIAVAIVTFRCGTLVVTHPPTNALNLSVKQQPHILIGELSVKCACMQK